MATGYKTVRQKYKCKDCGAITLGSIGYRTISCKKCGGVARNMGYENRVKA